MLAIQKPRNGNTSGSKTGSASCQCTPNILPCRIHHDGPLDSTLERYWNPTTEAESNGNTATESNPSQIAYFRGRKLKGHPVPIPAGYNGILATPTTRTLPPTKTQHADADEEDEEDDDEPPQILDQTSTFNEFVVWSHERAPVASEDPFIRGVEEWVRFAEVMHSNPEEETGTGTTASRNKVSGGESNGN
ncbi:hypothetical protein FQN54_008527 [Arachnomyces sp. PD_36]|nr:hypothetical protein FQN54_008527 [Arachnomyces sp. PD_36]